MDRNDNAMDVVDEPTEDNSTVKLIDLPELCLDKILLHLSSYQLYQVAISNSVLNRSAKRVFALKSDQDDYCVSNVGNHDDHDYALNMLKIFGSVVKCASIQFTESIELNEFLLNKIVRRCSTNLVELTIVRPPRIKLNAQFPNLQKIAYKTLDLDESWTQINKWFPNLRDVYFSGSYPKGTLFNQSFVDRIPNLEKISIRLWDSHIDVIALVAAEFINVNAHIKTLEFSGENSETIQSAIKWNELQILELNLEYATVRFSNLQQLQNLKSLKIYGPKWLPSEIDDPIMHLQIEKLEIDDVSALELIKKCSNIKILKLISSPFPLTEYIENLTELVELHFVHVHEISTLEQTLIEVGKLKKLRCIDLGICSDEMILKQLAEFTEFIKRATKSNGWQMKITTKSHGKYISYINQNC